MLKNLGVGGVMLAMTVGLLSAQQSVIAVKAQAGLDSKYLPPTCELKPGDFRISSGATYLKTGIETSVADNRARALRTGQRVVTDAITNSGQGKNPAAWYFLGRIDLQQGDLIGADTSLAKAEALAPACKDDIHRIRHRVAIALHNAGAQYITSGSTDSAMIMYRAATMIDPAASATYAGIASIFNDQGKPDSAIAYFDRAVTSADPTDTSATKIRNQAAFNHAVLLVNAGRSEEARASLRQYLGWVPDDEQAKSALQSLESGGGGSMAASTGSYNQGVEYYNAGKFTEAAAAFSKAMIDQPNNRDAINALANSYLGLKDGPKLVETARRLVALEPLNELSEKLLLEGCRLSKKPDESLEVYLRMAATSVSIENVKLQASSSDATLTAITRGRDPSDADGKAVAPSATAVTFEFLDRSGGVVSSAEVTIPVIASGATQPLTVKGTGAGIVAWRYKAK
ncbi:MAG: tetratricopeptide repeat protein [Gemmatimonadales bacterium]